jgi:plastocyanin
MKERMKKSRINACIAPVSALLVMTMIACGGGGSSTSNGVTDPGPTNPGNASTTMLTVSNDKFTPAHDSVGVGATLVWSWNSCTGDGYGGSTCTSHSVTFDDGPTSPIQSSGTFSRTFANAGTYTYHCKVHGAAMTGSILVQ